MNPTLETLITVLECRRNMEKVEQLQKSGKIRMGSGGTHAAFSLNTAYSASRCEILAQQALGELRMRVDSLEQDTNGSWHWESVKYGVQYRYDPDAPKGQKLRVKPVYAYQEKRKG